MAKMLTAQGLEVGVYSFETSGHMSEPPVPVYCAPAQGNLSNPSNLASLCDTLQAFSPAVVVNQMPYEHAITETVAASCNAARIGCLRNTLYSVRNNLEWYASRLLPSPLVQFAKNPLARSALLGLHRRRHARDLRRILSDYDRFVMFAEPNLDELEYFVPDYDPQKIALIPNSIERVAEHVPKKSKRILWLGRVSAHQKRADLILPLWHELSEALPDWTLDVVGDGPLRQFLEEQARVEGVPRVVFHGRQPSQPFFERAAIYLMTSDFEGFPNTLVEAQAQGAVPVAFDTYPMARWLVRSGDNGVLVPAQSYGEMVSRVIRVARSEEDLNTLARGALASAAAFSFDEVAVAWRLLLDDVIGLRGLKRG
ncbi:glycosyltransferase [Spiribacter sp. 221]|uniref:glycosyltransferase n=1 Tax=Spiribacter onubensis TaxID=3122420 RepID=UPI00349F798B